MDGIVTTEECPKCGYVFIRYIDHQPDLVPTNRSQSICKQCSVPVAPKIVRHPDKKTLDEI